jgi:hypothetical protein
MQQWLLTTTKYLIGVSTHDRSELVQPSALVCTATRLASLRRGGQKRGMTLNRLTKEDAMEPIVNENALPVGVGY